MKLFVWDFHGVLEKGNDHAVLEFTNSILQQFGYSRRMTTQEAELLAGKRWHQYFAYLLPDLDHQEHLSLQSACFKASMENPEIIAKHIQLNDHAELVLQSIAESPFTQILISNTHNQALDIFVKIVGIEKYFPSTHRFGIDSHIQHQVTKKHYLDSFVKDKSFPGGMISIGDSPSDMELIHGNSLGLGYLYTHPGRSHRAAQCDYKIHDLRELLREIKCYSTNNL